METFSSYAYYYNLVYRDKNYEAEAKSIQRIFREYQDNQIEKILSIGCGTGEHDIWMHQLGYKIKGIDSSPQMIEIANKHYGALQDMRFEIGDARNYRSDEKFDAVISLFHVMSYQNENEHIMGAFETAYHALNKNGLLVFDAWYGPGGFVRQTSSANKKD